MGLAGARVQHCYHVLALGSLEQFGLVVAWVRDASGAILFCQDIADRKLLFVGSLCGSIVDFLLR